MTRTTWIEGVVARGQALLAAEAAERAEAHALLERYVAGVLARASMLPRGGPAREREALRRFRADVLQGDRGSTFWRGLRARVQDRIAALEDGQRAWLSVLGTEPDLFEPMDYTRAETSYTRVLAWLLSPSRLIASEPHDGLGTEPLRALLRALASAVRLPDLTDEVLREAHAQAELGLGSAGRIDVCLFLPGCTLAIEAKVDASAGDGQLAGYHAALDGGDGALVALFLTPEAPDEVDLGWTPITFADLLRVWLPVAAAGDSGQHLYLRAYLKSIAGLYDMVGSGGFERWGVVTQLRVLQFLNEGVPS